MNSSKDKHEPPNLLGGMDSQIPHCLIRSSLLMTFFGALTFSNSTVAFSLVTFSFWAATLAARTCPRWVTGLRTVPSSSDATKVPEASSEDAKTVSAPSTGLRKLMPSRFPPWESRVRRSSVTSLGFSYKMAGIITFRMASPTGPMCAPTPGVVRQRYCHSERDDLGHAAAEAE